MAGLYIHIPFCKQACHYCNFHFSTNLALKTQMLDAINAELVLRKNDISKPIDTIYLGGGTPSLMTAEEIEVLFECIKNNFEISSSPEITIEANPDDLTKEKLVQLYNGPINRLSIGLQSFYDVDLEYMNRSHNGKQAEQCLSDALAIGFENISIDLIYGSPTTTDEHWINNVNKIMDYGLPHISCYALTVEPKTALDHFIKSGKMSAPDDAQIRGQFFKLLDISAKHGYEHYEISNFAKPGGYSRHNTSYWQNKEYLGIGPAAHSYNGKIRTWNIANNPLYIKAIEQWKNDTDDFNPEGHLYDFEHLSEKDKYNEFIMTRLRTVWGISLSELTDRFDEKKKRYFLEQVEAYVQDGQIAENKGIYVLSRSGKLMADKISSGLFLI